MAAIVAYSLSPFQRSKQTRPAPTPPGGHQPTLTVIELETRLKAPPKTPNNSSTPPSKGQRPNHLDRSKKPRRGRPGVARTLAASPGRIIEATLDACPHCQHALGPADQPGIHAYDHIDLPLISPAVTRINRHRGRCPCCRERVVAPAPEGFEPGSPFGPGLCALIIHLHVTQAISFERLACLLAEVFGLTIPLDALASGSEGAIANILARAETPLMAAAAPIADAVRASPVVGSDETSARVGGKTWWQWVLLSSRPRSRGSSKPRRIVSHSGRGCGSWLRQRLPSLASDLASVDLRGDHHPSAFSQLLFRALLVLAGHNSAQTLPESLRAVHSVPGADERLNYALLDSVAGPGLGMATGLPLRAAGREV